MKQQSDESLIILCKNNNSQAMEILFDRYKPLLAKITRSYFLLGADQDDLMQEAMIGLYKAVNSFLPQQNASFKTFASLCVRRNILSAIKKNNTQKNKILNDSLSLSNVGSDDEDENFLFLSAYSTDTDEKMIEKEKFEEVKQKILKTLSKLELLILNEYLKGHSYEDMAKNTGKSKKSVDNAITRIKTKLQFLIK